MGILIENNTCILDYAAEQRDGSGVVAAGANVKLKVYNITQVAWWTGSAWGTETELTGTATAAGAWHYSFAIPNGDEGDFIQVVWYDETDGTVIQSDVWRICNESDMILKTLTDLINEIEGMGSGQSVVTLTLKDEAANPVVGAYCVVRNSSESAEMGHAITDADGQCSFQLDDGAYKVRYGAGLSEGGIGHGYEYDNPYDLTVSGTTAVIFTCTVVSAPAGGLTYAELRSTLQLMLARIFKDDRRYVLDAVGQFINAGYQELDRKLRWTRCTYTFETVDGQNTYIIPSRVREFLTVTFTDEDGNLKTLDLLTIREWIDRRESSDAENAPAYWVHHGDRVFLYPTPDTDGETVTLYVVGEPPNLSNDDDKPGFPVHLHQLIIDQALVYCYRHFGEIEKSVQLDAYIEQKVGAEKHGAAIERGGARRVAHRGP